MMAFVDRTTRRGPRVPFQVWGWTTLLVVLLSATPSGSQVLSRLVGSAFDPAAVSVALGPKQPKSKVFAKASVGRPPDALDDAPPTGAAPAILPVEAGRGSVERVPADEPLPPFRGYAGLSVKAHGARAPPHG